MYSQQIDDDADAAAEENTEKRERERKGYRVSM